MFGLSFGRISLNLVAIFVTWNAIAAAPSAAGACPALTMNERYNQVRSSTSGREQSVAITHLLSEVFTPILKHHHDQITQGDEIKDFADMYDNSIIAKKTYYHDFTTLGQKGFESAPLLPYIGYFQLGSSANHAATPVAPYNPFNRSLMSKLMRAILVLDAYYISHYHKNPLMRPDVSALITSSTFAQTELYSHLNFAMLSLLQSVAQITSSPVDDLSAEEIFRLGMASDGAKPSLVVLHSILLAPGVLGENGSKFYLPNAVLHEANGRIAFSPEYRQLLKRAHDAFQNRKRRGYFEFGHGCPVAHCVSGEDKPGLQYFLDTVMYIFDRIPSDGE